jgi:hypothetical protein
MLQSTEPKLLHVRKHLGRQNMQARVRMRLRRFSAVGVFQPSKIYFATARFSRRRYSAVEDVLRNGVFQPWCTEL